MAKWKQTLEDRIDTRNAHTNFMLYEEDHVRAELNRLARQVRKLYSYQDSSGPEFIVRKDVLALLKEAAK